MHKNIFTLVVAALLAFPTYAQPRRTAFPGSLDASAIAAIDTPVLTRSNDDNGSLLCIIEFAEGVEPEKIASTYGFQVNTVTGQLATAVVPVSQLFELAADGGIVNISAATSKIMTDKAASLSNVDKVHALATPYTGNGVIIGVIDSGFDFGHEAFKDASGNCRIKAVWDQNLPSSTVGSVSKFGYGIVVDSPDDIASLAHDISYDTHGTHVAAIASSSADIYRGMAPEAELVLVSTNKSEAGMVDGLKFLLDYADAAGKPLAVNISMGTVIGFKDGNDNLAVMIDRLAENQTGKIVSVAAGNEGHRRSTIVSEPTANGVTTRLVPPSYNRENLFVGANEGKFTLTLTLHNAQDETVFTCSIESDNQESVRYDNFTAPSDGSFVALSAAKNTLSAAYSVSANLYAPLAQDWYWVAEVKGEPAKYIITADYGELSEGSTATTIACTACGNHTISVGAYVSRPTFINLDGKDCVSDWTLGDEYPNSGKGPTFDGRNKPDVMAPGASVISAINSFASSFSVNRDDLVESHSGDGRTYYWGAMSGTSMATPVVTGVIALWLQANPQLTVTDAHKILAGMEKLDAMKGIEMLTSGLDEEIAESSSMVEVYDLLGNHIRSALKTDATNGLKTGIYILRSGTKTQKIAVTR